MYKYLNRAEVSTILDPTMQLRERMMCEDSVCALDCLLGKGENLGVELYKKCLICTKIT